MHVKKYGVFSTFIDEMFQYFAVLFPRFPVFYDMIQLYYSLNFRQFAYDI